MLDTGRVETFTNPRRACTPKLLIYDLNNNDVLLSKVSGFTLLVKGRGRKPEGQRDMSLLLNASKKWLSRKKNKLLINCRIKNIFVPKLKVKKFLVRLI